MEGRTTRRRSPSLAAFVPLLSMLGAVVSLSIGSSLAKRLFPLVGATGATAYRVFGAALVLTLVWRPWRVRLNRRDAVAVGLYGVTLGVMNLLFYQALRTVPLGLATAIEFSGPLVVAVASSRRVADFGWTALAIAGLTVLLPFQGSVGELDRSGVAFAFAAAVCGGLYILFGKRIGHLHGGRSVASGMAVASLVAVPVGVWQARGALLVPASAGLGLLVGILSSAIPYSLEMIALKRLPKQAFGVMLSMDPAVGALVAFLILGERLTLLQGAAVAAIMAASIGMALTTKQDAEARDVEMPPS